MHRSFAHGPTFAPHGRDPVIPLAVGNGKLLLIFIVAFGYFWNCTWIKKQAVFCLQLKQTSLGFWLDVTYFRPISMNIRQKGKNLKWKLMLLPTHSLWRKQLMEKGEFKYEKPSPFHENSCWFVDMRGMDVLGWPPRPCFKFKLFWLWWLHTTQLKGIDWWSTAHC